MSEAGVLTSQMLRDAINRLRAPAPPTPLPPIHPEVARAFRSRLSEGDDES